MSGGDSFNFHDEKVVDINFPPEILGLIYIAEKQWHSPPRGTTSSLLSLNFYPVETHVVISFAIVTVLINVTY